MVDPRAVRRWLLAGAAGLALAVGAGSCGVDRDELATAPTDSIDETTTTAVATTTSTTAGERPTSTTTVPDTTDSTTSVPPSTDGTTGSTTPNGLTPERFKQELLRTSGLTDAQADCVVGRVFAELSGEEIDAIFEAEGEDELDPGVVVRFTEIVISCAGGGGD